MCPIRMGLWHSRIHYPTHGNSFIIVPFTNVKSRQKIEKSFLWYFYIREDKIWDCMDVLSIPHLMNGSRDIWEGPNMRIWTNIGRKGEPGENIFNIPGEDMSWAESMGDNDINGIWTLHQYHMVRRQHLWQIRDISARIRIENIWIKRSLCSHYKTLSITTRVWVVCCGTKRACVI